MLHVYESEVTCCSFQDVMTSKTLASIDLAIIVWTCIFEAAGRRRNEAFHTITDFTLLHVLSRIKLQITDVIFSQC